MITSPFRRRTALAVASTALVLPLLALPAAVPASAAPPAQATSWVGSWATAVTPAAATGISATGFTEQTLRQAVHLSQGGDQVRVRLSNVYGTTPLVVRAATVGLRGPAGGASVVGSVPLTFDGRSSVTLPPGTEWLSDPLAMTVADDSDLLISTYLPGPTGPATQHPRAYSTTYVASGDATGSDASAFSPLSTSWYFLDGVDVRTRSAGAVVLFGDSITDGVVSSVDANRRYGDALFDRVAGDPDQRQIGVLNAGISANRVLEDRGTGGDSMLRRFERDVLGQTAATSVILLEGINDIGNARGAADPAELIAAYRQFIARARAEGLTVVGATLTPFEGASYYTAEGEADRQAVNHWIRTSGEYDAVVDFDAALRDPANPGRMLPQYDIGDHLHPNDAGFAAMAAAVDLAVLR